MISQTNFKYDLKNVWSIAFFYMFSIWTWFWVFGSDKRFTVPFRLVVGPLLANIARRHAAEPLVLIFFLIVSYVKPIDCQLNKT